MVTDSDAVDTAEALADEDEQQVVITDWKVGKDGRLHIPKDKREKYDIEDGDFVDAVLVVGGE